MKIADVLASIDQGTMALPEFQRGYVSRDRSWVDAAVVTGSTPSGPWWRKTQSDVTELRGDQQPFGYRCHSCSTGNSGLHRCTGSCAVRAPQFFQGNAAAFKDLYFDLRTETPSSTVRKMKTDPLWISVTQLFRDGYKFNASLNEIARCHA